MKPIYFFFWILVFEQITIAQLTETDTLNFSWKLSSNGSWLTGNVERLIILSSADIVIIEEPFAIRSSNTYQYGTVGSRLTENDFFSRTFFYLFPRNEAYPYLMGWVETNRRRNFYFRYQIGPGFSWEFINDETSSVKVSFTATYEMTNYQANIYNQQKYNGNDNVDLFRGTIRLFGKHKIFDDKIRLTYEGWGQRAFDDRSNHRLYANIVMEVPLTKLLSFRTGYNYYYESLVLSGVKSRDSFLYFGVSIGEY